MPEISEWKLSCGSGGPGEASRESHGSTMDEQSQMAGPFWIRVNVGLE